MQFRHCSTKPMRNALTLVSISSHMLQIVDKKLMDGADEFLQIMDLCTVIMVQFSRAGK